MPTWTLKKLLITHKNRRHRYESWTTTGVQIPGVSKILLATFKFLAPYLLTPWCRVLLEKLTGLQLVKKFPALHGTRRFITALTSVRHLSLSCASPIQSIHPHPTSWRSILKLSTHLRLGLPSGLLPSGFPSKTLYTPLSSPIRATCPAHLILLDFITRKILGTTRTILISTRQIYNCGMTCESLARCSLLDSCKLATFVCIEGGKLQSF